MQIDDLQRLFDPSDLMARGQSGRWTGSLELTCLASNVAIALACGVISVAMLRLWKWRRDVLGSGWILAGLAAFIGACGLCRVCDVAVFWLPAYRLYTLVDAATAALSTTIAVAFPLVVGQLIRLPTIGEFRRVNEQLERACVAKDRAFDRLEATIRSLKRQVAHLERMRRTGLWVEEQESILRELKTLLNSTSHRAEPS